MHHTATPLDIRRVPASPGGDPGTPAGQWTLPLDGNLALAPVQAAPATAAPSLSIVDRPAANEPPPELLRARASRFVQALVEVSAGDRPITQMSRWMSPHVYADFVDRLDSVTRTRSAHGPVAAPRARVVSVHVRKPTGESAEIAARVVHGRRSRAIALRLEVRDDGRQRQRWMCTALAWG